MINMYDISEQFVTTTARRLEDLRLIAKPTPQLTDEFLRVCREFTDEREKIFRRILRMRKGEETKKAEVKDFSLTLFRKMAVLMGVKMLNNLSDSGGYFVFTPYKPRVVMVFPEGNKLSYWFIRIRMRSLDPHLAGRLVSIFKTPYNTIYLQPKVLDHKEYEHLIRLLEAELEDGQKSGEEVMKSGLPENNCNR